MENWLPIEDFEDYSISDQGRVRRERTGRIMRLSRNQRGFVTVLLRRDGLNYYRSVGMLVAKAFVPPMPYRGFDCLIHLDFNRDNNIAENLMWRPRWFAIKYRQQFNGWGLGITKPIYDIHNGTIYDGSFQAAIANGLLNNGVQMSVYNHEPTYPTNQEFDYA